jgi:hypothetical protein
MAAEKAIQETKPKETKIKFILSPTGQFNLAYNIGEVIKINSIQATALIDAGFAEIVK